ncbi:L-lactate dehydrogenase [Geobacter sp. SVR]|uniref:lactate/malate family dehydrogenase n=1 Tax=Geobacter sp. SVR TaxID=2495594 RepID=UPI0015656697|nr:L-lactate dehydrogenase [Geobacter sp. SVR]
MKIGIVGCGFVGSTAAYAMVMRGVGQSIVLVDADERRARAEAADIAHAVPFAHRVEVTAGEYPDLRGAAVVVIAAGVGQKPGETRPQLLERNARVFRDVVPAVLHSARDAVLLVATHPVDAMTHLAAFLAEPFDVPPSRIIGTGTTLDTALFRSLLSSALGIDPRHVHAYVLGEHGDSEVLGWSLVTVGGMPLDTFALRRGTPLVSGLTASIDRQVRRASYEIIAGKQASYYGIGSALAKIVDIIVNDRRSIQTVCTPLKSFDEIGRVTISLPHLLGRQGVLESFPPALDQVEQQALRESALVVRKTLDVLGL